MWSDSYIGLPFIHNGRDRDGCDCWGLVCLVYDERLGEKLTSWKDVYVDDTVGTLKTVARSMEIERCKWEEVDDPKPYDVVLFRKGNTLNHVGIVIDKHNMLHILKGINACIEQYDSNLWRHKIRGFYRRTNG